MNDRETEHGKTDLSSPVSSDKQSASVVKSCRGRSLYVSLFGQSMCIAGRHKTPANLPKRVETNAVQGIKVKGRLFNVQTCFRQVASKRRVTLFCHFLALT